MVMLSILVIDVILEIILIRKFNHKYIELFTIDLLCFITYIIIN